MLAPTRSEVHDSGCGCQGRPTFRVEIPVGFVGREPPIKAAEIPADHLRCGVRIPPRSRIRRIIHVARLASEAWGWSGAERTAGLAQRACGTIGGWTCRARTSRPWSSTSWMPCLTRWSMASTT
ncbi:hypothetical protein ACFPRL_07590 [Pseudoclavibacter helvolus]